MGAAAGALGFTVGALAVVSGPMAAVATALAFEVSGPKHMPGLGGSRMLTATLAAAAAAALLMLLPAPPRAVGLWSWGSTGLMIGALGVLTWLVGAPAGWHWGLSVTGPARSLGEAAIGLRTDSIGWGTVMLVGIPVGSCAAAYLSSTLALKRPPLGEVARRFSGGVLMGMGGTLAAGCNIGNALTGLSILATNSFLATGAMLAGVAAAVAIEGILRAPTAGTAGSG